MDFVSPVIDIISRVWDCTATRSTYLRELKKNLNTLRTSLDKLKNQRNDVKRNVDDGEANPIEPMKRTDVVDGWLRRVEDFENEVEEMLEEGSQQINTGSTGLFGCFCYCRPKNCWTGYKLGKLVVEKLGDAEILISEGRFDVVVVARSQPAVLVQEMPITRVVAGMNPKLDEIWRLVTEQNQVRILGLYGMGGVGKTTLMKKLNNEFKDRHHDFDLVLWVMVSQDLNLEKIQKQIGDTLGLKWGPEDIDLDRRATDIFKVLSKKKFVLLLDDIWQRVDLQSIGIPPLDTSSSGTTQGITSSKVVFTTRSEDVCGHMEVHKKIRVECLDWDEAWSLFQMKVGEEALNCHPKVPKLAEIVAKECGGLPLALNVIGRTMSSKKTLQEWEHAITVLQRSASEFSGMSDQVLSRLKFSYDNLENEKFKICFLYCSLYPEDYPIEKTELIDLWIAEGFLDEVDDINIARNEGHHVIGCLKDASLLESGVETETHVTMHDIIRDFAIWVTTDHGRKKGKFLTVQTSNKPKLDEWENAKRISLIDNDKAIDILIEAPAPNCLKLSTLLLQRSDLSTISDDFFQSMPVLRILNMSRCDFDKFPASVTSLIELKYLNLSHTKAISHASLQTGFFKSLVNLKYLDMSYSWLYDAFTPGEIACLSNLQMLDLFDTTSTNWENEGGPSLSELEGLKHLNYLGIKISTSLALRKLVSSHKLQLRTRRLSISCNEITSLTMSPSSPSIISLANMVSLKELSLHDCYKLEELRIMSWEAAEEENTTLLQSLERLCICYVLHLKIVWEKVLLPHHQFCFANLQYVEIGKCDALKDLTWLIYAQGLKRLRLWDSNQLEEIICSDGLAVVDTFSRLKNLDLDGLPNLKSICKHPLAFPCLESIEVYKCPQLKKLPLDTNSANNNTLRRITGERKWWESLDWEDETIKSTFDPYFKKHVCG